MSAEANRDAPRRPGAADVGRTTQLLFRLRDGDRNALAELTPLVHSELREIARRHMGNERIGHTLQPTELVHEAFLRLVEIDRVDWRGRAHFVSVASRLMRRVLIDHARRRTRRKRGGGWRRVPLGPEEGGLSSVQSEELIALDAALERLVTIDERQAQIVEMRFFGGLTIEETAAVLGISSRTVKRDWSVARAWLLGEIGG